MKFLKHTSCLTTPCEVWSQTSSCHSKLYWRKCVLCTLFENCNKQNNIFWSRKKKKPQNKVTDRTEVEINREESPRMDWPTLLLLYKRITNSGCFLFTACGLLCVFSFLSFFFFFFLKSASTITFKEVIHAQQVRSQRWTHLLQILCIHFLGCY